MRGQALSNTRKLNKHWQSGGNFPEWWNSGTVSAGILSERVYLAPFYKFPNYSGAILVESEDLGGPIASIRGISIDDSILNQDWPSQSANNGRCYIANGRMTPSIGNIGNCNTFRLFYNSGNNLLYKDIDVANGEQINLLIPYMDIIFLRRDYDNSISGHQYSNEDLLSDVSEFMQNIVSFPSNFSPDIINKKLPIYYCESSNYSQGGLHGDFYENTIGQELLTTDAIDLRTVKWGNFSGEGIVYGSYGRRNTVARSDNANFSCNINFSKYTNNSKYFAPVTQLEPITNLVSNFSSITYVRGYSAFYSDSQKFVRIPGPPNGDYNLYNGSISPYNICGFIDTTDYYNPQGYVYIYMTRLREFRIERTVING